MMRIRYLFGILALITVLLPLLFLVFPPAPVKAATSSSINPASVNVAREVTRTAKTAPASGPVGTEVTLSGSGFTGVTKVAFKNAFLPKKILHTALYSFKWKTHKSFYRLVLAL